MRHIGLVEGIGGFSLAARWMGWQTIAWCELNSFCQKILKHHFPNAKTHSDIRDTDFTIYRGQCDILTGGFPCQPYSTAGKRLGKEDERHLWPEMLRAVREIRPLYVVGENVSGLLSWNEGLVFNEVQTDLENEGYEVWPFVLPAQGLNAPHERKRVWFIACRKGQHDGRYIRKQKERQIPEFRECIKQRTITNAGCQGLQRNKQLEASQQRKGPPRSIAQRFENEHWPDAATRLCRLDDGLSGKLDGITFSKWKRESLKAYGNAIVPQIAFEIFKAIEETEKQLKC